MNLFKLLKNLFSSSQPKPAPTPSGLLIHLHDKERGQTRLTSCPQLTDFATQHAQWMARNRTLSHDEGKLTFLQRINSYHFWTIGENVGLGDTPFAVFEAWMKSPKHRANILNPAYKDIGIGVASGGGRTYWCVILGSNIDAGFQISAPGINLSGPLGP